MMLYLLSSTSSPLVFVFRDAQSDLVHTRCSAKEDDDAALFTAETGFDTSSCHVLPNSNF